MNLFTSVIKWTSIGLFACFAYAATLPEPIKLYVIYTYKFNERVIEKIFIRKDNAQKYCEQFKDSHDYTFEEITVKE
jgi:hypothetical protein